MTESIRSTSIYRFDLQRSTAILRFPTSHLPPSHLPASHRSWGEVHHGTIFDPIRCRCLRLVDWACEKHEAATHIGGPKSGPNRVFGICRGLKTQKRGSRAMTTMKRTTNMSIATTTKAEKKRRFCQLPSTEREGEREQGCGGAGLSLGGL